MKELSVKNYNAFNFAIIPFGSLDLKTVFPATKISAPVCKMAGAFSRVTPPSISINVFNYGSH